MTTTNTIFIETNGPKVGHCNICGEYGDLTEDHIPPKGSVSITSMEMHHIVHALHIKQTKVKGKISQNGLKFRTLCSRCNNELLGTNYDKEFILLASKVNKLLKSQLLLPRSISATIIPQKIMRAVIGHSLAFGINRMASGSCEEACADYFLNPNKQLPSNINIYYWVYPYTSQILIRDAALMHMQVQEPVIFKLLKTYPLSFMLTYEEPIEYEFPLENFGKYRHLAADEEAEIIIDLKAVPPVNWPEAPTSRSMVLYGEGAMGALPYSANR